MGTHCLKSWSATQRSVTLSSGEAELVAAVRTSTETIGLSQLYHDWGVTLEGNIMVDSSAAISVAERQGCGKLRHIKVGMLWIQEKVEEEELKVQKIAGAANPADLMTKYLHLTLMETHMAKLGQQWREGRADAGLQAN